MRRPATTFLIVGYLVNDGEFCGTVVDGEAEVSGAVAADVDAQVAVVARCVADGVGQELGDEAGVLTEASQVLRGENPPEVGS